MKHTVKATFVLVGVPNDDVLIDVNQLKHQCNRFDQSPTGCARAVLAEAEDAAIGDAWVYFAQAIIVSQFRGGYFALQIRTISMREKITNQQVKEIDGHSRKVSPTCRSVSFPELS